MQKVADIKQHIEAALKPLQLAAGCKLVLAYSGGVDSESLAHGLSLFANDHPQYHYLLLHVHHGLSHNAEAWVAHCTERANVYQLPINVCRVKVAKGPRLSVEAEARKSRYNAIIDNMAAGDILLTAHHQDDQLETLLLAIKRGQGPKGLACMGQVQDFDNDKQIVRPILDLSRADIEDYANYHGFSHVEDESNQDNHYDRNFLRNVIIPQLKCRWPRFAATASRSAQLCAQQQQALDEEVQIRLHTMVKLTKDGKSPILDLNMLTKQTLPWQSLLLRGFIECQQLPLPSQLQLDEMLHQLTSAQDDARIELRAGNLLIRRFNHYCYVFDYHQQQALVSQINASAVIHIESVSLNDSSVGNNNINAADLRFDMVNKAVKLSLVNQGVRLRLPQSNEQLRLGYLHHFSISGSYKCHPHFRNKKRQLKKLWQELSVPVWLRTSIPVLFYEEDLVAVVGLWYEQDYLARDNELGLSLAVSNQEDVVLEFDSYR